MSKASKPIDIPKNLLEAEKDIDRLIIPKQVRFSKSFTQEISIDKIYISSSVESGSFTSDSSLQSLFLAEEVSVPKKLESKDVSVILSPLSASNKENITPAPLVSVTAIESTEETPSISLHAVSKPIPIPSSSESIMSMVSESLAEVPFLPVSVSDKNSEIVTTLQSDLEVNKKSLEQGVMQEEQGITTLGDGYFIFQLDE
jgi:hypothetical protein